jgi:Ca2+-binding RTX toxin-like protein
MFGGTGDDSLSSSGGTNVSMLGGSGNDTMSHSGGTSVTMFGGSGNDSLSSSGGTNVSLLGGSGSDTLSSTGGMNVTLLGGTGNSTLSSSGGTSVTMFGGSGSDSLTASGDVSGLMLGGTSSDILTSSGNTSFVLLGGTGDDSVTVIGGSNVSVLGGRGNDQLNAIDSANVTLIGGTGNSTLSSSGGYSIVLFGGLGNDLLTSRGDTQVTLLGGPGADQVSSFGDSGVTQFAGSGSGALSAAQGTGVILIGGTGNVTLSSTGNNNVTVYGGSGNDSLTSTGDTGASIIGGSGTDTLSAFGDVNTTLLGGGRHNDQLSTTGGTNVTLIGGAGNDTLAAVGGTNIALFGLNGNNVFELTGTPDNPLSVALNDLATFGQQQPQTDSLTQGINTILFPGVTSGIRLDLSNTSAGTDITTAQLQQVAPGLTVSLTGQFQNVVGTAGNNWIKGDASANVLTAGSGNDTLIGNTGPATLVAGSGSDLLVAGSGGTDFQFGSRFGSDTIDPPAGSEVNTLDFSRFGGPVTLNLALSGPQVIDASGATLTLANPGAINALVDSAFNDRIIGNKAGDRFYLGAGNDTITGGGGSDSFFFTGSQLGSDTINETSAANSLNFFGFGGPVHLDLNKTGTQVVAQTATSGLSLTLPNPAAFNVVVGSPYSDTILAHQTGNATIIGGGGADSLVAGNGNDYLQGYISDVVYVSFPTQVQTTPGDHVYTPAEEQAVLAGLERVYAAFQTNGLGVTAGYIFTLDPATAAELAQATGGQYKTLFIDAPVIGGAAGELNTGGLDLGGSAQVNVTPFQGDPAQGLVAPTSQDIINLTVTVAAHELGHLSGLQHQDAVGPIGSGIYSGMDPSQFYPFFTGPENAYETPSDIMASPDSVGSTLADAAGPTYLGERDLVNLAFNDSGIVLAQQNLATGQAAFPSSDEPGTIYQIGDLPLLAVPNALPAGVQGASATFNVSAVAVNAVINPGQVQYFSFNGTAGQLMTFQVISATDTLNAQPILPALELLDARGNVLAFNVHEFESSDSTLFDVTLPADGTYYVGVLDQPQSPAGNYQLFMYSFALGASSATGATLVGGSGNDTLVGSSADDQFLFPAGAHGNATVVAGSGQDVVDLSLAPQEHVTATGNVTVKEPTTFTTALTASATPNPSSYGQTVTFTATVTTDAPSPATGMVDFFDQTTGTDLGTATLQVVKGQDVAVLQTSALAAGSHVIVMSYAAQGSYLASSDQVTQVVDPATLTVTANPQTKIYGQSDPTLTYQVSGLENGDTADEVLSGHLSRVAGEHVGTYAIGQGDLAADTNYTLSFVGNNLSITPATLTITADDKSKLYGEPNPPLTASYSGFVNGDTVASLTTPATLSTTATQTSPVGTYKITASGASDPNYTIKYVDGTLTVTPAQITVTNTNDSGPGSLRQAILNANTDIETPTIVFAIPGSGPQTIHLLSALPSITEPMIIDGTTQPGYTGQPLVVLDGSGVPVGSNGLYQSSNSNTSRGGIDIIAGGTTVRGLCFDNFAVGAIGMETGAGNLIADNYIGTDPTGTVAVGNGTGIEIYGSSNNVIQDNLISGLNGAGPASGIDLTNGSSGNRLVGNLIGMDGTGMHILGNIGKGIAIHDAPNNTVGGTTAADRNVISGNQGLGGIGVGEGDAGTVIIGNYIGTDITGLHALGSAQSGIEIDPGTGGVSIGGTASGDRNVISGNNGDGIIFNGDQGGVTVIGNYIGVDATGLHALGNLRGIELVGASDNTIGGTAAGDANVISGNSVGVNIIRGSAGNVVLGNDIGVDATGSGPLGNFYTGVAIVQSSGNTIGGTAAGAGNIIAYTRATDPTHGQGVWIDSGTGNAVLGNSIFGNANLGIVLTAANNANNNQAAPVLTQAVVPLGGGTNITGSITSTPSTTFHLEFFSSPTTGEGETLLGTASVTTDATGAASFSVALGVTAPFLQDVTATATDPAGDTSAFSAAVTAQGVLTSSVGTMPVREASDTFTVPVTFTASAGLASMDLYVSANGGPFVLAQTLSANGATTGTVNFSFTGADRNTYAFHSVAHDDIGATEPKSSTLIESSTFVPDLNPPVTHAIAAHPGYSWGPFFPATIFSGVGASSYASGVFTIKWVGADPDQPAGGTIASLSVYVQIDGGAATLVGTVTPGNPTTVTSGGTTYSVYSGSMTFNALGDGQVHTYSFYSVGTDDLQNTQAVPSAADVSFTGISYIAPLSATLSVEKGLAERSYIRYLDVTFNQTVSTNYQMAALQSGLAGSQAATYVELLWWGENLTATSTSQGSVNLFGAGTTATVTLSRYTLSIDFGANGITSLLTENNVSGTGSPKTTFGDGWYALAVDPYGDPSKSIVLWLPFFRLLGDVNGDGQVTGPTTTAGTDAYLVNQARGQSGSLLNADVNGDGAVNSTDLQEAVSAANAHDKVGATAPQTFPQFQLLGGHGSSAAVGAVTEEQVQALLPEAIAAWQAAGLNPAGVQALEQVRVQVVNLGTSILGLENPGLIQINRTAAGQGWDTAGGSVSLLTVLEHELGHVVGLGDNAVPGDLMNITLAPGVLRVPTPSDVVATGMSPVGIVSPVGPGAADFSLLASGALLGPATAGMEGLLWAEPPTGSMLYQGSAGGSVLVAGAGDELLIGDSGRDRLVGGFVAAPPDAGPGADALVPGVLAGWDLERVGEGPLWDGTSGLGTDEAVRQLARILNGADIDS